MFSHSRGQVRQPVPPKDFVQRLQCVSYFAVYFIQRSPSTMNALSGKQSSCRLLFSERCLCFVIFPFSFVFSLKWPGLNMILNDTISVGLRKLSSFQQYVLQFARNYDETNSPIANYQTILFIVRELSCFLSFDLSFFLFQPPNSLSAFVTFYFFVSDNILQFDPRCSPNRIREILKESKEHVDEGNT